MIRPIRSSVSSFPVSCLILPTSEKRQYCNIVGYFILFILFLVYICSFVIIITIAIITITLASDSGVLHENVTFSTFLVFSKSVSQ